ncbi:hypothetical protein [Streptomyces sp. NPDC101249]|uniref:hypothetical protein n=1 Tax=Streptomyces sp. NPDC101249 TaxID=3366140 RepID=UPI00380F7E31
MSAKKSERLESESTLALSRVLDAAFGAFYAAIPAAAMAAVYAVFWDGSWTPFWTAVGVILCVRMGARLQLWKLEMQGLQLEREGAQRREKILLLQQELAATEARLHRARVERIQLEAHRSAIRAENLEAERLLLQRKIDQEARDARRHLEIACAAVEADRLEAAAWRMELNAKQLELKLNQADLFETLSVIDDNAQDRIMAAYEQGFDHGQRGIVLPRKYGRRLRVVEDSA